MEKIISFIKMEELRKNKMRTYLIGITSSLLLLTACSRKLVNNKSNYVEKRKEEIAANEKQAIKTLEKKFKVDQDYAMQLIQHSNTPYYSRTADSPGCLIGKVIIRIFDDSAQTKPSPVTIENLYEGPGQIKQYSTIMNGELFSRDIYYRNNYFLLDSIVKSDRIGLKSKVIFKYEKDRYSIVSVDDKLTMKSIVFYLNDHYQCIKKETFNGSGDLVGLSTFNYDNHGRIAEETDETRVLKYEYKNGHDLMYAVLRIYDKKSGELQTEDIQLQNKNLYTAIYKSKGKMFSKATVVTTPDGCIKNVYNYNGDNKIITAYEYIYQH